MAKKEEQPKKKDDKLDKLLDDWKKDVDSGLNDGWKRRK